MSCVCWHVHAAVLSAPPEANEGTNTSILVIGVLVATSHVFDAVYANGLVIAPACHELPVRTEGDRSLTGTISVNVCLHWPSDTLHNLMVLSYDPVRSCPAQAFTYL